MISQIASVFSSQGVVLQDSEWVEFPVQRQDAAGACDHKSNCKCFSPVFDQASAKLELSQLALKAAEEAGKQTEAGSQSQEETQRSAGFPEPAADRGELTPEEKKVVEKLKERDREVRNHEMAHLAASGGHARGGAHYKYEVGPDGKSYAVGGHVAIDVGPVSGNPEATLQKAMTVQRAALAPADPSGADQAVAAAAAAMAREAVKHLADERAGKAGGRAGEGSPDRGARANPYARAGAETGRFVNAYA